MNKFIKISLSALASLSLFVACDDIAEDNRFRPAEPTEVARVVLVQEFTGMSCVNCPYGAALMHQLMNDYPGNIVTVGIHPEGTPYTAPLNNLDLTCPDATEYYNYYRPTGFPAAIVDGDASKLEYTVAKWQTLIENAMEISSPAEIELETDYNPETRQLSASFKTTFTDIYSSGASVLMWVIENDIHGMQLSQTEGVILDYAHEHVLRGSMNGVWGTKIGDSFQVNDIKEGSATITLKDNWVAENCQVVAFVFQSGSKKVIQTTIADVVAK